MVVGVLTDRANPTGRRKRWTNILYVVIIAALAVFGLTVGKNL